MKQRVIEEKQQKNQQQQKNTRNKPASNEQQQRRRYLQPVTNGKRDETTNPSFRSKVDGRIVE